MKRLATDHYSAIGYQHLSDGKPCQDHTLSDVVKDYGETFLAYAVVSDGCSSGGETDIGARLLTTLSAKHFRDLYTTGDTGIYVEEQVFQAAALLDLQDEDLLATHLYAVVDTDGEGLVVIKGDGAVVLIDSLGLLTIYRYEWADELPYYPCYNSNGLANFYHGHGGRTAKALTVSGWRQQPEGEIVKVSETEHTVEEGCKGMRLPIVAAADIAMICLFSDGIWKVQKLDWLEAIKQITNFRGDGFFVKRRMGFFIKDMLKIGRGPIDDISVAVIAIKDILNMPDLEKLFDDENPDLLQEARDILGEGWLTEPNSRLGGQTPEDVINEGRGARVRDIIRSVKYIGIS